MQAVEVSQLSLQFQLVRTGQDGVGTRRCWCQPWDFHLGPTPAWSECRVVQ